MGRGKAARAAASPYLTLLMSWMLWRAQLPATLADELASLSGVRQFSMEGHAKRYTQQDLQHVLPYPMPPSPVHPSEDMPWQAVTYPAYNHRRGSMPDPDDALQPNGLQ